MVLPVKYCVTPAFLDMRLPPQAGNTADSTAGNTGPFEVATPRNCNIIPKIKK